MTDFPSRGISLKAFDEQGLVRLRNEFSKLWEAVELLKAAQSPPEVSTEVESDQGIAFYEPLPVVVPEPTEPEPDDDPEDKDDPLSMAGFEPTVTPEKDGKKVSIDWSLWPGVNNPKVYGYKIYFNTTSPCPITSENMRRRIVGNDTSVEIKRGIVRGVSYDFRVQPFARGERRKEDIDGIASE